MCDPRDAPKSKRVLGHKYFALEIALVIGCSRHQQLCITCPERPSHAAANVSRQQRALGSHSSQADRFPGNRFAARWSQRDQEQDGEGMWLSPDSPHFAIDFDWGWEQDWALCSLPNPVQCLDTKFYSSLCWCQREVTPRGQSAPPIGTPSEGTAGEGTEEKNSPRVTHGASPGCSVGGWVLIFAPIRRTSRRFNPEIIQPLPSASRPRGSAAAPGPRWLFGL